ncbi:MAG: hypothetical protein ACYC99_12025 [Candidatus Geothermincolia bacterium]
MEIDKGVAEFLKERLGYSDDEVELFLRNPRNEQVMAAMAGLAKKTIIAEVVESHGCFVEYRTGDRLYFDGGGNLISSMAPKRVCPFLITSLTPLLFAAQELVYAGADPNEMRFNRAGCPDVGLKCGGWGHVVLELRFEDRDA